MAYYTLNFESQYLHGNTNVGIVMPNCKWGNTPKEFYASGRKYKVLWLLHGTMGDYSDWSRLSMVELYAAENDLVVVMPSTHNASYTNWPNFCTGFETYDYLVKELMPLIYGWLPVSGKREDNFIAGDSMGGLGALEFALTQPEKFAGAAILSACPHHYEHELQTPTGAANHRYQNLFANAGGYEAFLNSDDNVWRLCEEMEGKKDLPDLYFIEGEQDEYFDFFAHFRDYAKKKGYPVTIETIPGYAHEWRFWNRAVQRALEHFGFRSREGTAAY